MGYRGQNPYGFLPFVETFAENDPCDPREITDDAMQAVLSDSKKTLPENCCRL